MQCENFHSFKWARSALLIWVNRWKKWRYFLPFLPSLNELLSIVFSWLNHFTVVCFLLFSFSIVIIIVFFLGAEEGNRGTGICKCFSRVEKKKQCPLNPYTHAHTHSIRATVWYVTSWILSLLFCAAIVLLFSLNTLLLLPNENSRALADILFHAEYCNTNALLLCKKKPERRRNKSEKNISVKFCQFNLTILNCLWGFLRSLSRTTIVYSVTCRCTMFSVKQRRKKRIFRFVHSVFFAAGMMPCSVHSLLLMFLFHFVFFSHSYFRIKKIGHFSVPMVDSLSFSQPQ